MFFGFISNCLLSYLIVLVVLLQIDFIDGVDLIYGVDLN